MTNNKHEEQRKADFGEREKPLDFMGSGSAYPGQSYPHRCPYQEDALGEPLSIKEAAKMLGCSPWTVRQTHIPSGLPCLRSGPLGKLIFYRAQLVRWILEQQQKGAR